MTFNLTLVVRFRFVILVPQDQGKKKKKRYNVTIQHFPSACLENGTFLSAAFFLLLIFERGCEGPIDMRVRESNAGWVSHNFQDKKSVVVHKQKKVD